MRKLAIIPARGGSKRIPRKNIRNFLGTPIIAHTIKIALSTKIFDEVMVSTDDEEISKISKFYGAKVPFLRSEVNSSDMATTGDVILEVINYYENNLKNFDFVCCIYPTSVFLNQEWLNESFNQLNKNKLDTVFSAVKYGHPIQRSFVIKNKGKIKLKSPKNLKKRTQDLKEYYYDAAQFYWIKPKKLKENKELLLGNAGAYIIDQNKVQDIDNISDWNYAELKYKIINNET